MSLNKRTKLLLSALALLTIFGILIHSKGKYAWSQSSMSSILTEKTMIDAKNNEGVDAAINREISKEKTKEETGVGNETKDSGDAESEEDFDPATAFLETRALAPMTIFSKSYCPFSKQLKKLLLENYSITPAPQIVELDKHKYGKQLQAYVAQISDRKTVPNVLIGTSSTISKGGYDEFMKFHQEDTLADQLNLWGGRAISVIRHEKPSNS